MKVATHRYPRTAQESREVITDVDFSVKARKRKLPNCWDDKPRGDHDHRSWKRHRRNQWKAA